MARSEMRLARGERLRNLYAPIVRQLLDVGKPSSPETSIALSDRTLDCFSVIMIDPDGSAAGKYWERRDVCVAEGLDQQSDEELAALLADVKAARGSLFVAMSLQLRALGSGDDKMMTRALADWEAKER
jgi:hypothetical protein